MLALSDLGMTVTPSQAQKVIQKYIPPGSTAEGLSKEEFLSLVADIRKKQRRHGRAGAPPADRREGGAPAVHGLSGGVRKSWGVPV